MKSYTDLEQSNKLKEILPLESADMHYSKDFDGSWFVDFAKYTSVKTPKYVDNVEEHLLPCWSLAALINIINANYYTALYHDGIAWNIDIIHHDNVKDKHSACANTPIDAFYEIIIKL